MSSIETMLKNIEFEESELIYRKYQSKYIPCEDSESKFTFKLRKNIGSGCDNMETYKIIIKFEYNIDYVIMNIYDGIKCNSRHELDFEDSEEDILAFVMKRFEVYKE